MAVVALTNTKLTFNTAATLPATAAATSATDGISVAYTGKEDGRILLILENASAADAITATVKKGNGLQGVADLTVSLAASAKKVIVVESGKYVNVKGADKGKLFITGSTNLKAAAIELP